MATSSICPDSGNRPHPFRSLLSLL